MKRFSVALATILALLAVGTASARVPQLREERKATPATRAAETLERSSPRLPVPVGEGNLPVPGLPSPDRDGLASAAEAAGLPAAVADILRALPFGGAGAAEPPPVLPGVAEEPTPEPSAEPEPATAEPQPQSQPAAPARPAKASAPRATVPAQAAGSAGALFPGLPAEGYAAASTGTVIHADALTSGGVQLLDVEVAFSGASFTGSDLSGPLTNEVDRVFAPQLGVNNAFGRGSGLEIGAAQGPGTENQVVLANKAEAKAPPSTALVSNEVGPVDADPVAVASLLRGQAQSRAGVQCTTDIDLSYGQGYAADIGLLTDAIRTIADDPTRVVSQSTSRTRFVRQEGSTGPIARFGLMTETRQTIAPVQVGPLRFEFLGEWVLRAVADGKSGSVHYGPGEVEPQTPIINITGAGDPIVVLAQDLLGNEGLEISVPGVAEIVIGEDARAIDGDAASQPTETPTLAAGAVDVVRVVLADGALGDIRIGHMEAAVAVPEDGIACGIGLVKTANPESVNVGESFTWNVTVSNPNDCVLTDLKVVDTISTTPGVRYSIVSSQPAADSTTDNSLTWNDIGPLQPGQSRELVIRMRVAPESSAGRFTDDAVATGVCGPAEGEADAGVGVPLEARVSLNLPEVLAVLGEPLRGVLPRTGGLASALPAMLLTGLGVLLQRTARRRLR